VYPKVKGCYMEASASNSQISPEGMVYPRITTSDENSFNTTMDNNINRSLGIINEDQIHGRLSRQFENDQGPNRCKFFTTLGTNIRSNGKHSRIIHTKSRTPSSFVYRLIQRREYGK
jgi:hypothetical protein